jgi:hypothetical protein
MKKGNAAFVCLLVVLCIMGALKSHGSNKKRENQQATTVAVATTPTPTPEEDYRCFQKDRYPIVGDRGVLRDVEGCPAGVLVAYSASDSYKIWIAMSEIGTRAPGHGLFQVPSGTEVICVDVPDDGGLCQVRQVRFLSGRYKGRTGFVPYDLVTR